MLTPSGYTLHRLSGWLSLAGLALCFGSFIAVMFSVMMRHIGIRRDPLKPTETNSTATLVRSATPARQSLAAKLRSRLSTIRTRTKGFSHLWGTFLSLVLVASWALWGGMAIRDHGRIKGLEAQLAKYRADTVTEHHVAILGELGHDDFSYKSDEHPHGNTFRPCLVDMANGVETAKLLRTAIGYEAIVASWEERGTCESILRADLGFTFRDETTDFKYRRISR
jgi:hypothetical protein